MGVTENKSGPSMTLTPNHQGFEAYYEGQKLTDNPYLNDPRFRESETEWAAGWLRAQAEEQEIFENGY